LAIELRPIRALRLERPFTLRLSHIRIHSLDGNRLIRDRRIRGMQFLAIPSPIRVEITDEHARA
jgi:hypothetical protein